MDGGLGRGEPALALEGGHQAVIVGDLLEHVVLQQVDPGVADVHDGEPVLSVDLHDAHRAEGRAHPGQLGIAGGGGDDLVVGELHRPHDGVGGGLVDGLAQRRDGQLGGHLTGLVATHAVGHGEKRVGREHRVLVVLTHQPRIGGRAPGQAGHASSSTVLPICTRSPACRTMAPATFCRLR